MKIAFISNFLNHHQLPFCLELNNKNDVEYYFIATEEIPQERINLGYEDMNAKYDFVIETYKSKEKEEEALKIINDSDFVIIGSAPEKYIQKRIKDNKITFRYSERIFKKGFLRPSTIRIIIDLIKRKIKYINKKEYMLCASAYTKKDYSVAGLYKNKYYKWGYFPATKKYNIENLIQVKEKNEVIKLLWAARFIDWKHPELVVELAKELKKGNYKFKIEMLGCGEMLEEINEKIKQYELSDVVETIGAVQSAQVREYMENANIFLVTSDQNEGWGAVVNEAMNSGCAIVGNKKIGSIPYLIKDGKNGLTYSNKEEFFSKVKYLFDNDEERKAISKNAYNTIVEVWNAKNATDNLIKLCKSLMNNQNININEGPCSKE